MITWEHSGNETLFIYLFIYLSIYLFIYFKIKINFVYKTFSFSIFFFFALASRWTRQPTLRAPISHTHTHTCTRGIPGAGRLESTVGGVKCQPVNPIKINATVLWDLKGKFTKKQIHYILFIHSFNCKNDQWKMPPTTGRVESRLISIRYWFDGNLITHRFHSLATQGNPFDRSTARLIYANWFSAMRSNPSITSSMTSRFFFKFNKPKAKSNQIKLTTPKVDSFHQIN